MSTAQNLIPALYKLSDEDFNVTDDTILDKLYCHLSKCPNVKDNISTLLPKIGDWFEVVIRGWTNKNIFYGVQIFSIRFIGYVGSLCEGFEMLQDRNVLTFIQGLISSIEIQNDSCLMVPLINACELLLNHQDGWKWTINSMISEHVVKAVYDDRSIYTKRAGVRFILQLLTKSTSYDPNVGKDIMSHLCKPLVVNHLLIVGPDQTSADFLKHCMQSCIESDSKHFYNGNKIGITPELVKAAKYLCDILQDFLLTNELPVKLSVVYRAGTDDSVFVTDILDSCSSHQNHQTFSMLLILVEVSNLFSKDSPTCNMMYCCLEETYNHIDGVIKSLVSVGLVEHVVNFCVTCLSWMSKVKLKRSRREFSCNSCNYYESTLVYYMMQFLGINKQVFEDCESNESRLQSLKNYSRFTSGPVLTNALSDVFLSNDSRILKPGYQFIQQGVLGITRSLDSIQNPKNIRKIFVDVQNSLNKIMVKIGRNDEADHVVPTVLHLLNLLNKILEKHKMPVSTYPTDDSDETLVSNVMNIISMKTSDIRVQIISLRTLMNILKHHLLPELISEVHQKHLWIIEFCDDSIIKNKLECKSWEVRDTTIEFFGTVLDLAELMPQIFLEKFSKRLLNQLFEKASNDESAYVKASALQFFSKTVRCKYFDDIILPSRLLDLSIEILLEDNMPIARKSACNLIAALYVNYVPDRLNDTEKIFDSVFVASTKDLDWEVKITALNFWQCTINKHLMDQRIPNSQSTLPQCNPPMCTHGVVSRIITVLDTLGEIGCLKAIWIGLTDDCDLKVCQEAQSIVENLEKINEQWNFLEELMKSHEADEENITENSNRRLKPKEFFSMLEKENWRENIDSRKNWIENTCDNVESLLEHILDDDNRMDDWDHNAVDCY